ncbi:MAG: phospho-N-acetylmuramoyl-pentapeptide-transferase [Xanthomonadaceae bacterium]|nr:phospho-N-acetylmuramoyl-pentapeptide-transferase [Rhodospirillaceae bacterium]NIA17834.1 phospho-N-acetylmuramoyl-pentapeptide-transferase [Xanthomonadaceae bacterium]
MLEFYAVKVFTITTLSFLVALFWMPFLLRMLKKYKISKRIRDEESAPIFFKLHKKKQGTPTMGGILIWGTVLFLSLLFFYLNKIFSGVEIFKNLNFLTQKQTFLPLGALVASAIVGIFDDLFNVKKIGPNGGGLRMRHRLFIYTFIAIIGAWWFYYKLGWSTLHVPFLGSFDIGIWYIPIFIFVIVATSHSVNLTDGLDGLAGGILLSSFASYGAIAFVQGRFELATFCGAIIGSLLAFLWFNISPAKFFMGDTGAMSLGITLGIVAMLTNYALLLPIIGLIFVIETCSVLLQWGYKKIMKKKLFISSPIHHHLEAIGWAEATIVMRFWVISGVSSVIGLILFFLDKT